MIAVTDHFERLGLPRRFGVDAAALEAAYLARSRAFHPDRHQLGSEAERLASTDLSAALNEAYATLRDPFRRAEHLLALLGGPSAAETKDHDPAFLMEMLDLREKVEDVRSSGAEDRVDLENALADRRADVIRQVAGLFAANEANGDDPARRVQVRRQLNVVRYLDGLLRDIWAE